MRIFSLMFPHTPTHIHIRVGVGENIRENKYIYLIFPLEKINMFYLIFPPTPTLRVGVGGNIRENK
jgi:hypothetical protein